MHQHPQLVVCGAALLATAAYAQTLEVEVKKARLTEQPVSLSKTVAQVQRGDAVSVQKKQGDWWHVKPTNKSAGWITRNALARRSTQLTSGETGDTGVSQAEQAAAYRPLSEQAEEAYRKDTPASAQGYAAVDAIDRSPLYEVADSRVEAFVEEGQLQQEGF